MFAKYLNKSAIFHTSKTIKLYSCSYKYAQKILKCAVEKVKNEFFTNLFNHFEVWQYNFPFKVFFELVEIFKFQISSYEEYIQSGFIADLKTKGKCIVFLLLRHWMFVNRCYRQKRIGKGRRCCLGTEFLHYMPHYMQI